MRRWSSQLALGARLALTGGRGGWLRTGLTALGVGMGVALLLLAASVPHMLAARADRVAARDLPGDGPAAPADDTLLARSFDLTFRDALIRGIEVHPEGPAAPTPPGVATLPGPGELVVSPALRDLLASPDGPLLAPRLDYPVVGVIGEEGLRGPAELAFYLGNDALDATVAGRIDRFGGPADPGDPLQPMLAALVTIGFVVLLLPVATFVAAAARFGGEQRDRRLAAVRLVGADRAATRRIAAGEALLGAVAGVVVGAALFLVGRALAEPVTVWDINVFTSDIWPGPALAALVAVAAPALAVTVTLAAQRHVVIEPLGVVRRSAGAPRRLWWRLLPPAAGLALLAPLLDGGGPGEWGQYQLAGGVALLLVGIVAVLPWLVETVVRRLRGGAVAWQLATRRLQLSAGTTGRIVNGVAVAAAGGIALQMLFSAAEHNLVHETGADPDRPRAVATMTPAGGDDPGAVADRLGRATGVRAATGVRLMPVVDPAGDGGEIHQLAVGDCRALRALAELDDCRDGDVFLVHGDAPSPEGRPGTRLRALADADAGEEWVVPADARAVAVRNPPGPFHGGYAATPGAVTGWTRPPGEVSVHLELDPSEPDAVEHVRNAVAGFDPRGYVQAERTVIMDDRFDSVRRGLLAGITVTLLLIGSSLLVGTLEQLRERRRPLAVLVALGTPRRTLAWSVLWQSALPVALGLGVATLTGVGIGSALLLIVAAPVSMDWASLLTVSGAAATMVLLVTVLSLPALWRLMRADGLRTE